VPAKQNQSLNNLSSSINQSQVKERSLLETKSVTTKKGVSKLETQKVSLPEIEPNDKNKRLNKGRSSMPDMQAGGLRKNDS